MVELNGKYDIISNRESGFGRYDVLLKPIDKDKGNAYIIEFKVYKAYKEKTLKETLANAHAAALISEGFNSERIRKYGFAFKGKECLIG